MKIFLAILSVVDLPDKIVRTENASGINVITTTGTLNNDISCCNRTIGKDTRLIKNTIYYQAYYLYTNTFFFISDS